MVNTVFISISIDVFRYIYRYRRRITWIWVVRPCVESRDAVSLKLHFFIFVFWFKSLENVIGLICDKFYFCLFVLFSFFFLGLPGRKTLCSTKSEALWRLIDMHLLLRIRLLLCLCERGSEPNRALRTRLSSKWASFSFSFFFFFIRLVLLFNIIYIYIYWLQNAIKTVNFYLSNQNCCF